MSDDLDPTIIFRTLTVQIPTAVAQKLNETHDGDLEDAVLTAIKLYHGMGAPAYTSLQTLAKQLGTSVPKTMRTAIAELQNHAQRMAAPPTIGRPKINTDRDTAIYLRIIEGETYAAVARAFGVSLVRVGQIVAQQRAMRGISPKANTVKRNEDILQRLRDGQTRQEVAAALGVSRSVVDNLVAMERAKEYTPKVQPTPQVETQIAPQLEKQLETQEVLTLKQPEALDEGLPAKPRFVIPSLEAVKAKAAQFGPDDGLTAIERDVFDPEFGF
jgi:hypothetical protein